MQLPWLPVEWFCILAPSCTFTHAQGSRAATCCTQHACITWMDMHASLVKTGLMQQNHQAMLDAHVTSRTEATPAHARRAYVILVWMKAAHGSIN